MGGLDLRARARAADRATQAVGSLVAQGVAVVALTWVDNSGITRTKAVPASRLEHAAAWGVGTSPVLDTFLLDDSAVTGRFAGGPVGDLRLHPDLDRLAVLAAQPGWAWAPADRYDQDGQPHAQDARVVARREVARLREAGFSARAAFEVEWVAAVPSEHRFIPAAKGPAYGMARVVELSDYLRDIVTALSGEGVEVVQIHPEYATSQFEVSVAAEDPVGAADTAVLVRETIRGVSARNGLRATFSPKVLADGVGNGAHVHLSLWREAGGRAAKRVNLMAGGTGAYGLTDEGEAFTAGILAHLPALLAVGAPSAASYLRLIPSHWAGVFACWGLENREAALRLIAGVAGNREEAANVEVKCFDAAANPYLAVAALLAAGRAGLAANAKLPAPVDVDPAALDRTTRYERGILPLPSSLAASVAAFESDDVLRAALGEELADTLVAVRRGEIALTAGSSPEEITALTRWKH